MPDPVPVSDLTERDVLHIWRAYRNIIRILHLECNFPNLWYFKTTIKEIKTFKGTEVQRKPQITLQLLLKIKEELNLTKSGDSIFWAACVFGLLRKPSIFGTNAEGFHKNIHLTRDCFIVSDDHAGTTTLVNMVQTYPDI